MRANARNEPEEIFEYDRYLEYIVHDWLQTLTILGFTLIPIFFILDYFMLPTENLISQARPA